MCFPLAIPLALIAGGAGMNYLGSKQADKAQWRTFQAENQRQKGWDAQQNELFSRSLDKVGELGEQGAQDQAVDRRKAAFIEALGTRSPQQGMLPGMDRAPSVVGQTSNKVVAATNADSERNATALARLTAPGDQLLDANIALGRNSQQIGQLGANKQRSAAVLESELRAAAMKGAFLRGLGQLAMAFGAAAGGGQILGGAGGGGGAAAGAEPTVAGTNLPGIY